MRARYNKNAVSQIEIFDRYISSKDEIQKKIQNKKVYVEIGMGKGDFITQMAINDKDNIYIGIELSTPILALAIKKLKRFEECENIRINNIYFMSFDAIKISQFFNMEQIDKIFLNFSDPWPKSRHEKRRLTNSAFLNEYKYVLKENAIIEFKTDNRCLFEYSLVSMQNFGMSFLEVYLDLHKTDIPNILTEYEEKFSKFGPIYKLVVEIVK